MSYWSDLIKDCISGFIHHHCGDSVYCGSSVCGLNSDSLCDKYYCSCPFHFDSRIGDIAVTKTDVFYVDYFFWPSLDWSVCVPECD